MIKKIFLILGLLSLVAISFYLGFIWNTGRFEIFGVPKNIFTCLSYNNTNEAYQMNCFLPVSTKKFVFSKNIKCIAYTNQTFGFEGWRQNDPKRNSMTFHKSEKVKFNLQFVGDTITRGTPMDGVTTKYKIIKNTADVIQGVSLEEIPQKTNNSVRIPINNFAPTQSFITISKNYGKGMEVWHNGEWYGDASIGSFFFQCE